MASSRGTSAGGMTVATTTSPKSSGKGGEQHGVAGSNSSSPKAQCLCSPTTHQGSFRCKFHRSTSAAYFKRSKSMPPNHNSSSNNNNTPSSLSPKSVESAE